MNDFTMVWHNIKAKLYPNYLKKGEGYIARTDNNKTLTEEDICKVMKTRLELPIRYEDLLNCMRQYIEETLYQACDGYAVTNGYFTIYPHIGGTFAGVNEAHDHDKHKVAFSFSPRAKLRRLARSINVEIDGMADTNGYIDKFTDLDEDAANSIYVPGNQFVITGSKIRVEGSDPGIGVFLVPEGSPAGAVKITRIGINNPSMITGILPNTGSPLNKIEVRTQFTGATGKYLKAPRIITSSFVLEEV